MNAELRSDDERAERYFRQQALRGWPNPPSKPRIFLWAGWWRVTWTPKGNKAPSHKLHNQAHDFVSRLNCKVAR